MHVADDWRSLMCTAGKRESSPFAINALTGARYPHHPAFFAFVPWHGELQQGMITDFLGMLIPRATFCNPSYAHDRIHALRVRQCKLGPVSRLLGQPIHVLHTAWPVVSEEYFEYVDILESVLSYCAEAAPNTRCQQPQSITAAFELPSRPYTFVELGSGYGHFTFAAHRALQQKLPSASYAYLLVDVVASLADFIQGVAANNSASAPGAVRFHAGFLANGETSTTAQTRLSDAVAASYQSVWRHSGPKRHSGAARQADMHTAMTLAQILELHRMPCLLDWVDIDIDGAGQSSADTHASPASHTSGAPRTAPNTAASACSLQSTRPCVRTAATAVYSRSLASLTSLRCVRSACTWGCMTSGFGMSPIEPSTAQTGSTVAFGQSPQQMFRSCISLRRADGKCSGSSHHARIITRASGPYASAMVCSH